MTDAINESIAHLTAPSAPDGSGRRYQVLTEDGADWDEAATVAAYQAGEAEWKAAQNV